jgi:imidazole glycerol-phosphate synthase subunit HisF
VGLKRRIIAKFLIEDGRLVKFKQFTNAKRLAGNVVSTARTYEDLCVDEMHFCDLGVIDPAMIRDVTANVFTPVTVAGSIHSMGQVDELIQDSGADKVVVKDPRLAEQVAQKYGQQAVVWPIDYHTLCVEDVPDYAGEVLLTDIDRDGMGKGFDLDVLKRQWNVPVVIAGGCGKLDHVKQAFANNADGVAISSMFFFSDKSPIKLRSWLVSEGATVRDV